jgi:hypothetical protein
VGLATSCYVSVNDSLLDLNTITLSWPAQGASLEVVRSRLLTHALKSLSINFLSVPEDVQQKFLMTIVDSFMKLDLIQISFVVVSPRLFLSFLKGILTVCPIFAAYECVHLHFYI